MRPNRKEIRNQESNSAQKMHIAKSQLPWKERKLATKPNMGKRAKGIFENCQLRLLCHFSPCPDSGPLKPVYTRLPDLQCISRRVTRSWQTSIPTTNYYNDNSLRVFVFRAFLPAEWILRCRFSLCLWICRVLTWIFQWIFRPLFCPLFEGTEGSKKSTEKFHTKSTKSTLSE